MANHNVVSPLLGISWVFIILPACILYLIDWFRYNESQNKVSKIGKAILRFPIGVLGVFSILIGSAIIIWVLYNIFVERQNEYTGPSTILGGFGVGPSLVVFGFYLIRLAIRRYAFKGDQDSS